MNRLHIFIGQTTVIICCCDFYGKDSIPRDIQKLGKIWMVYPSYFLARIVIFGNITTCLGRARYN